MILAKITTFALQNNKDNTVIMDEKKIKID